MAIEKRQTLGEVTGTLGNIVRRKRYGKIVVYIRSGKYRKSKSLEAKAGRNSFALSVALARVVNSISDLKQIWQLANLEGVVAYNRIIKYNKQYIKDDSLTVNNIITPKGIHLLLSEFKITNDQIQLTINLKEAPLNKLLHNSFNLHLVLYAFNPKVTMKKPYELIGNSNLIEQEPVNNLHTLSIPLDTIIMQTLEQFSMVICYVSASKYNGKKKELFWSSTVARQFDL